MSEQHTRFDEEHRKLCEDCTADYHDFAYEQALDAHLDALAAEQEAAA